MANSQNTINIFHHLPNITILVVVASVLVVVNLLKVYLN